MGEDEAEEMAVKEMGNPVDTGVQLDKIHRPKTDVWIARGNARPDPDRDRHAIHYLPAVQ